MRRGNYALSALVISTAMLVTAILAAVTVTHVAGSLHQRADAALSAWDCVYASAVSGADPSDCLRDLNVPDVNVPLEVAVNGE